MYKFPCAENTTNEQVLQLTTETECVQILDKNTPNYQCLTDRLDVFKHRNVHELHMRITYYCYTTSI